MFECQLIFGCQPAFLNFFLLMVVDVIFSISLKLGFITESIAQLFTQYNNLIIVHRLTTELTDRLTKSMIPE